MGDAGRWDLFEAVPDAMFVTDRAGLVRHANERALALFGYTREELVGAPVGSLLPERYRALRLGERADFFTAPRPIRVELAAVDKNGREFAAEIHVSVVQADDGPLLAAAIRDVTAERRAAEELRASNAFLEAVVENIPNMIFVKDAERLAFLRFNRAGEELLGLSREALLGKNDYDFFPPDEAAFFQEKDRQTLEGGLLVDIPEEPIQTKQGTRLLHTKKVPIRGDRGEPLYLLGISEDITERRRAERELLRLKEATEEANRELEAFSYSVAHDLRAPLRSIDGFSQALLEDCGEALDESGKRYLRNVRESAQLMARLIDDILGLSRVTRQELSSTRVDLTALARGAAERLARSHPARRVDVVVEDGVEAEGDPRLLSVVLENLLGNAWKFTAKQGAARIEFGARREEDTTVYFVRDNGAGFDMTYATKLFGLFQRLHTAKDYEGTGIGLATVQRIVRRHRGRIWAEGTVGAGATFHFTLNDREEGA